MKYLVLLFILVTAPMCLAGGWSQTGKIVEVYNLGFTVMIRMDGTFLDHSNGSCTGADFYAIDNNSEKFDPIFSQILMAYASGKTTKVWVDGAPCSGQGGKYQTISSIRTY